MVSVTAALLFSLLIVGVSAYHVRKEVYWHCFDIYEVRPQAQNVTLLCSDTYMEILEIKYLRPLQIGDSVCTNMTYNYDECCNSWRSDHVQCIVPYADDSVLIDKCEHQDRCDVVVEPHNRYGESEDTCSGGTAITECWSRGVMVAYVCYSLDKSK